MAVKTPLVLSNTGEIQQLQAGDSISTSGTSPAFTVKGNNTNAAATDIDMTVAQTLVLLGQFGRQYLANIGVYSGISSF